MRGTRRQGLVHRHRQRGKCPAVRVLGRAFLRLLPQVCKRIVVRGIRRQRCHGDTSARGCPNSLGCCPGMLPCPIMDAPERRRGWLHEHRQEPWGTFRVQPPLDTRRKQASRARLQSAKHLVSFALATGVDFGLRPAPRPRGAQRALLGTTGLLCTQAQTLTALGRAQHPGPCLREPVWAPCGVELI